MAIKYPGQTLQQYGRATVIKGPEKTLAAMSEANRLGAQRKAAAAKAKAAAKKAHDDNWKGIDKDGVRPADLPDINNAISNVESFHRSNAQAIINGDPQTHAEFSHLKRQAEDMAHNSSVAHTQDVNFHNTLAKDPESYTQHEQQMVINRIATPMSADAWGETEAVLDEDGGVVTPYNPGFGNYMPQKIFDFSGHIDKFKPSEQAFESVRKSGLNNKEVQGYITKYGVEAVSAAGIAHNNYDQIKLNRSALQQIREKEGSVNANGDFVRNDSFMDSMDSHFKESYDRANQAGDRHGQQKAIYGQMLLNAAEGKETHQIVTPYQATGVGPIQGASYFSRASNTSAGLLHTTFTRNMQYRMGGQGQSINMAKGSDADKEQWSQTYFNQSWEDFSKTTGITQEAGYDMVSTRPGKVIGIQPASGDDVSASKLSIGGTTYYKTKISETDDGEVNVSGVRTGPVSMTVSDIRSMDVWQENTSFAIMEGGVLVMNPNEEQRENGVYVDAKKGGIVPAWIINSEITSEKTRPLWKQSPVLTGVDKDDNEIYVPLPLNAQGKVDEGSGQFTATMAWYASVVQKSAKGRDGFDYQGEYALFKKEVIGLTGTVR